MNKRLYLLILFFLLFSCSDMLSTYGKNKNGSNGNVLSYDISVSAVNVINSTPDRQNITISGIVKVDITTSGTPDAGSLCDITVFEDRNGNNTYEPALDSLLGTKTDCAVPGNGIIETNDVPVNGSILFGGNYIHAFADSSNQFNEPNENNNYGVNLVTAETGPSIRGVNPVVEWEWTGSTTAPLSNQLMQTPLVINLNDDNLDGAVNEKDVPDIIFVTFQGNDYRKNGTLRAVSGDGSGELFTVTGQNISPTCTLAVGDVDNDGLPEIIGIAGPNPAVDPAYVCCIENNGTFKWFSSQGGFTTFTILSIADIDCDGTPEILAGNTVINSSDGSVKWAGANPNSNLSNTSYAVDLDLDGIPEIISGNTAYRNNGSIYWQASTITAPTSSIADMDSDNYPEIIISERYTGATRVYCLEHTGQIKWGPVNLPSGGTSTSGDIPLISNTDSIDYPEIIIANGYHIYALNYDGTIRWQHPIDDPSSGITGCSAMDLNNDGIVEIAFADQQYFRIYNGSTGSIEYEMEVGNGTFLELPVFADVDNDGQAEIIVSANDYALNYGHHGFIVYGDADKSWMNTTKIWNQNAYHIDNVSQTGIIPMLEDNYWLTHNSFRQAPVYATTAFGCELSASWLRIDSSALPASCTFTARVGNCGPVALTTEIFVSFFDGNPSAGGTYLGRAPLNNSINAGEYEDVSFTWNSPLSGSRTIYVSVDDDRFGGSRIFEADKTDNVLGNTFMIP
ncbi:MAG: hypothetical protein JW982_08080 [Spirochaetes bacterium]|nr:hypothetical protein [Spirochaetota bacterium]